MADEDHQIDDKYKEPSEESRLMELYFKQPQIGYAMRGKPMDCQPLIDVK